MRKGSAYYNPKITASAPRSPKRASPPRDNTLISDAAMIDRVIGMDVQEAAAARDRVPRRDRGMGERPKRREIEGIGGRLWYELGH